MLTNVRRSRMPGDFDSKKDSNSMKFKRRHRILVKLSFKELYYSNLSGLHPFDNVVIKIKRMWSLR